MPAAPAHRSAHARTAPIGSSLVVHGVMVGEPLPQASSCLTSPPASELVPLVDTQTGEITDIALHAEWERLDAMGP
jgi:hypothetical protein